MFKWFRRLKLKRNHQVPIVVAILLFGVMYRLIATSGGNFIFNMDNARDMVDVREMVVLHKPRLIGPTSGIQGIYDGPIWYYMLAVPFVLTSGNPYSEIILMILFWFIGGIFLVKSASRFGTPAVVVSMALWLSSNYVLLATAYALNPNPVLLLTPLFIYLLSNFLKMGKLVDSVLTWALAGVFFNVEMAYGLFIPLIILASLFLSRNAKKILSKNFWFGLGIFLLTLAPQVVFYLRHSGLLTGTLKAFTHSDSGGGELFSQYKTNGVIDLYHGVLSATLMNQSWLVTLFSLGVLYLLGRAILRKFKDQGYIILICSLLIAIPFLGAVFLPLHFMPWHLGGAMAAVILILGIAISEIPLADVLGVAIGLIITLSITIYSLVNLNLPSLIDFRSHQSADVSVFANEVAAIDSTYSVAQGKNFKAYVYLPSVIDYPYQYLYWWRGIGRYGYTPTDYAYLPGQPQYIEWKSRFVQSARSTDSHRVFLIMEPDQAFPERLEAWRNHFSNLKLLSSYWVGPIAVEIRTDLINSK